MKLSFMETVITTVARDTLPFDNATLDLWLMLWWLERFLGWHAMVAIRLRVSLRIPDRTRRSSSAAIVREISAARCELA